MMILLELFFVIFILNVGNYNQVQDEYNNDNKEIKQEENEIKPPVEEESFIDEPIVEDVPNEEEKQPEQMPLTTKSK